MKYIADIIKDTIRKYDSAVRFGGDEFIILLDNIGSKVKIIEICDRIKKAVSKPFSYEGKEISVSLSIGAAVYPHDTDNIEELIKLADKAMYKSKSNKEYLNFCSEA